MSEINPNVFRIMQQTKDKERGIVTHSFPSAEIAKALKRMGLKRTPGTNGEGRKIIIELDGKIYNVLAIERQ